ncbi:hypothetical protein [Krasilnikoviella flava]|uniref:Uncharacterized protein n=1 Tax=Krasilnikoviella flava TaxID=526729 RepID=A0A1T5ILN4_9MICO|nr:hypothetical protein [Krasilnikoviella flava]SKC39918.1 hypothetical protein SAMN04324258_0655 [Krasilnikoviella flava]
MTSRTRLVLALASCTAALLAGLLHLRGAPPTGYSAIFAPRGVVPVAAALALVALGLCARRSRAGVALGWPAVVLLFWGSGGLALEGFRAFFAVTGIPAGEFAEVDVPGMVTRALAALAAVTTVLTTWDAARAARPVAAPGRRWPRYVALAMCVPYPSLKLYWWLGGTFGRPGGHAEGVPWMEVALFATGALVVLGLTGPWATGRLRPLLLAAGWLGSTAALTMGALMLFGTLGQLLGLTAGPVDLDAGAITGLVALTYGSWLLVGVALLAATLQAQDARRPVGPARLAVVGAG